MATDVCVPISQLAECVEETKRDIEASGLIAPIAGHVGDGNFHTQPLVDLNDAGRGRARPQGFIDRLVKRALAMGGTCTGEHGVGQKKMQVSRTGAWAGGARGDADAQAGARSAEHPQSRQNRRPVTSARLALPAHLRENVVIPPRLAGMIATRLPVSNRRYAISATGTESERCVKA